MDTAYGKWTPINDGTWMLAATIGKMDQPFQVTPMVFDPDYTPEGAALQATYKINDNHSIGVQRRGFCAGPCVSTASGANGPVPPATRF